MSAYACPLVGLACLVLPQVSFPLHNLDLKGAEMSPTGGSPTRFGRDILPVFGVVMALTQDETLKSLPAEGGLWTWQSSGPR